MRKDLQLSAPSGNEMKLKLDEELPIVLFLEKKDTNETPVATALNPDLSVLWTAELKHVRDGMYSLTGFKMPNLPFLRIIYDVPTAKIESDGEMILKYARAEIIYELETDAALQKEINNLEGKLKNRGFIIGKETKSVRFPGFILGVHNEN